MNALSPPILTTGWALLPKAERPPSLSRPRPKAGPSCRPLCPLPHSMFASPAMARACVDLKRAATPTEHRILSLNPEKGKAKNPWFRQEMLYRRVFVKPGLGSHPGDLTPLTQRPRTPRSYWDRSEQWQIKFQLQSLPSLLPEAREVQGPQLQGTECSSWGPKLPTG